jgi:quercetin dioxygenase-like cupin family protein
MTESVKRTILERFDVPESNYETVIMHIELAAGTHIGLHTHPGYDAGYLVEGEITVLRRDQPATLIRSGQSGHVRPGVVHEVKVGDMPTRMIGIYVVEKGKPLATPWQPPGE